MKLRTDLLKHLTMEDVAQVALANNHRYKPEPRFSKTGVGSLSPASTKDSVQEEALNSDIIRKVRKRLADAGRPPERK